MLIIERLIQVTLRMRGAAGLSKLSKTRRIGSGVGKCVAAELGVNPKTIKRLIDALPAQLKLAQQRVTVRRARVPKLTSFKDVGYVNAISRVREAETQLARLQHLLSLLN
jgi:hypothetical protein